MNRMRITFALICLTGFLISCSSDSVKREVSGIPAEWERQEAVFLTYTSDPHDPMTTRMVHEDCNNLLEQLSPHIKIYLLIDAEDNSDSLMTVFKGRNCAIENIIPVPVKDLFSMGVVRDYGPIIFKESDGSRKLLQFDWNYVGADLMNPDTSWENWKNKTRNAYFEQLSQLLKMDILHSDLMIEGGEIELNGNGTAMLVETFTKPRNIKFNSTQLDAELKKVLNLKNIIWLKEGVAEDPSSVQSYRIHENIYGFGVGGHIDEFARFSNKNTILLAYPEESEAAKDPIKKLNLERMKTNDAILREAKDVDGKNFTILKVPIPDVLPDTIVIDTTKNQGLQVNVIRGKNSQLQHGDTICFLPAASYLNFIVLNNVVIIPQYWKPGSPETCRKKDDQVKKLFTELYPDKKIISLSPRGLNYGGGGFHCWTQQVPY